MALTCKNPIMELIQSQVQIGCHSDDLSSAEEFCRAPVVVHKKVVLKEKVTISCIWGGLLYIIVKAGSQLGLTPVSVYGAEPAPTFINGQTSLSSWRQTIRNYPAPWAELITENIILTVPSDAIRSLENPEALMAQWDKFMAAIADLAAIPKKFPRPERIVADVQISAGWMHSGYPIMCHLQSAKELTDLENMKKAGLWGPIHELGHNEQRGPWEFPPHTTEATCNLWSVYVHETVLGIPRNEAHSALKPKDREDRIKQYLQNGAKLEQWSVWIALETYLQLQEVFGWGPFKCVFKDYQKMCNVSQDKKVKMNLWAEKFSQVVNKNLAPFFKSWGWPIEETTFQKLATLPAWEENPMTKVQIGCHSDDLSSGKEFCRAPVVVHKKVVLEEKVTISCIWGGLLCIIVKAGSQLGLTPVSVYGAEPAPTFINGQTSLSSWRQTIRNYPAPWAELITENIILTVPSEAIRSLENPEALMAQWDKFMAAIADLAAIPKKFPRPERIVADVQISAGWMHSGYPIMCHLQSAKELTDLENMKKAGLWGPIHELGHNEQRGPWEFPPHTTEATCNLWSVYVHETVLGIPRNEAHPALKPKDREDRIKQYLQNGAKLEQWSVWIALETYLQLQEVFGWGPSKRVFKDYQKMCNVSQDKNVKMNLWAEKFSQVVNKNLAPFFKSWGWPIEETTFQKLATLPAWEETPMTKY
ncbi:TRPM8 channel-associated factor 3-like [Gastrophryne carolinensis]